MIEVHYLAFDLLGCVSVDLRFICFLLLRYMRLILGSMQWPPAMKAAVLSSPLWQNTVASPAVPYGVIFSGFMAACLLGSSLFSKVNARVQSRVEGPMAAMLALATAALTSATYFGVHHLAVVVAAFFTFELCVGLYFPFIGTLRGKYLPDSHRSVVMNLFGVPLNLIVVSVFLSINRLGIDGALAVASGALGIATAAAAALTFTTTAASTSTPSSSTPPPSS